MIDPQFATNLYFDQRLKTEAVKLLPGEYYVTSHNMVLSTVLGSCVSACIYDLQNGIGGMNHFMLPAGKNEDGLPKECARFGDYAMSILIKGLLKTGANKASLVAKIFGGGNVQRAMASSTIGSQNARFVQEYLMMYDIPVLARDLEGIWPRKIHFFPKNGKVLLKKLHVERNETIMQREQHYGTLLQSATKVAKN